MSQQSSAANTSPVSQSPGAARNRLCVLFVEDSREDCELVLRQLKRAQFYVHWDRVEDLDGFTHSVTTQTWDIILSDYCLPALTPKAVLERLQLLELQLPVVVVSGYAEEDVAFEVMRLGACDYLAKDNLKRLSSIVRRELNAAARRHADEDERRSVQLHLFHAKKMEAMGQIASGITQEIDAPLRRLREHLLTLERGFRALSAAAECARQLHAKDIDAALECKDQIDWAELELAAREVPQALRLADDVSQSVQRILDVMQQFSDPGQGSLRRANLGHLLKDAVMVTSGEWKAIADVQLVEVSNLDSFPCYPESLSQVVLNILVNAAQAIADARRPERGRIEIAARSFEGGAEIRISDNGTGIRPEIRHRIFDPFFTTKAPEHGTGQGLALAYATIVNQHRGDIAVESVPGRGTTFILFLPDEELGNLMRAGAVA